MLAILISPHKFSSDSLPEFRLLFILGEILYYCSFNYFLDKGLNIIEHYSCTLKLDQ